MKNTFLIRQKIFVFSACKLFLVLKLCDLHCVGRQLTIETFPGIIYSRDSGQFLPKYTSPTVRPTFPVNDRFLVP